MSDKLLLSTICDRLGVLEAAVLGRHSASTRRRLSKRKLAEREDCSPRTIDRRVADGSLPPPDIINGRLFWWLDVLERHELERAALAAADTSKAARNPRLRRPAEAVAVR
jgi:hypothetical protein